jgi:hypothetical protein
MALILEPREHDLGLMGLNLTRDGRRFEAMDARVVPDVGDLLSTARVIDRPIVAHKIRDAHIAVPLRSLSVLRAHPGLRQLSAPNPCSSGPSAGRDRAS